jgi:hypothetical protein
MKVFIACLGKEGKERGKWFEYPFDNVWEDMEQDFMEEFGVDDPNKIYIGKTEGIPFEVKKDDDIERLFEVLEYIDGLVENEALALIEALGDYKEIPNYFNYNYYPDQTLEDLAREYAEEQIEDLIMAAAENQAKNIDIQFNIEQIVKDYKASGEYTETKYGVIQWT